jgi:hypothetical protein
MYVSRTQLLFLILFLQPKYLHHIAITFYFLKWHDVDMYLTSIIIKIGREHQSTDSSHDYCNYHSYTILYCCQVSEMIKISMMLQHLLASVDQDIFLYIKLKPMALWFLGLHVLFCYCWLSVLSYEGKSITLYPVFYLQLRYQWLWNIHKA